MRFTALVVLLGLAGTARAGDKDKADVLFNDGKKLLKEKRFADACRAFEESFKLDPGIGVELNIAKCYEEWGKLGRAYRAYQKAEDMAKDAHDQRVAKIHELIAQLEPQVPHLQIRMPADGDTDGLTVTIDGAPIEAADLANPQLVDPGPHLIEWKVGDAKKKNKIVPVERGATNQVTIDLPPKKVVEKPVDHKPDNKVVEPKPVTVEPADPGRTQKLAAYGAAGVGGVAIIVSGVMALSARSKYNTALASHCMNSTTLCDDTGIADTHAARHTANVATVVFLVGTAAVGAGVALYLTAPHAKPSDEHALRIVPTASPEGAGVVLGGDF